LRSSSSNASRSTIAMADSRWAMAMADGLALHERVSIILDCRLGIGIKRRGGCVEHQYRGVREKGTSDRDALPMAS